MSPSWLMVIKTPGNGRNESWKLGGGAGRKRDRGVRMEQGPEGSEDYWGSFGLGNEQHSSVVGFTTMLFVSPALCSVGDRGYGLSRTANWLAVGETGPAVFSPLLLFTSACLNQQSAALSSRTLNNEGRVRKH